LVTIHIQLTTTTDDDDEDDTEIGVFGSGKSEGDSSQIDSDLESKESGPFARLALARP
jgi:hypothetical protein